MSNFNKHEMTFGQAIELAKQGIPVSASNWDFIDRITGINETINVPVVNIWSPENRRIGMLVRGKNASIPVLPYSTKMTRHGIENYIPTNADMNDKWVRSDVAMRLAGVHYNEQESDDVVLAFDYFSTEEHLNLDLPFWKLYEQDMVGYHHNTIFIAGSHEANIFNTTLFNMMSAHLNNRLGSTTYDGFVANHDFYQDGWQDYCDVYQACYTHVHVNEFSFDVDQYIKDIDKPTNIIIDADSLTTINLKNGENALDHIVSQVHLLTKTYPELTWVSISISEEMDRSKNDAADDETFALKVDD